MRTILHAQRRSSIAAALITILLGLLLVFWPDHSVNFLCLLLGIALFVTGLIYLLGWIARRLEQPSILLALPGVVLCALGVWLMTNPASVVVLVQYIFGAVLLFHGLVDLQGAFALLRQRWTRWWLDLLLAVLTMLLGLVVLVNPFGAFAALTMLIGCSLIYDGISDLILIWRLTRAFRALEAEAEQNGEDYFES